MEADDPEHGDGGDQSLYTGRDVQQYEEAFRLGLQARVNAWCTHASLGLYTDQKMADIVRVWVEALEGEKAEGGAQKPPKASQTPAMVWDIHVAKEIVLHGVDVDGVKSSLSQCMQELAKIARMVDILETSELKRRNLRFIAGKELVSDEEKQKRVVLSGNAKSKKFWHDVVSNGELDGEELEAIKYSYESAMEFKNDTHAEEKLANLLCSFKDEATKASTSLDTQQKKFLEIEGQVNQAAQAEGSGSAKPVPSGISGSGSYAAGSYNAQVQEIMCMKHACGQMLLWLRRAIEKLQQSFSCDLRGAESGSRSTVRELSETNSKEHTATATSIPDKQIPHKKDDTKANLFARIFKEPWSAKITVESGAMSLPTIDDGEEPSIQVFWDNTRRTLGKRKQGDYLGLLPEVQQNDVDALMKERRWMKAPGSPEPKKVRGQWRFTADCSCGVLIQDPVAAPDPDPERPRGILRKVRHIPNEEEQGGSVRTYTELVKKNTKLNKKISPPPDHPTGKTDIRPSESKVRSNKKVMFDLPDEK
jgi:hypothetical protein